MVDLGQSVEEGMYSFPTKNGGFWTKLKVPCEKEKEKEKEKSQTKANKKQTKGG